MRRGVIHNIDLYTIFVLREASRYFFGGGGIKKKIICLLVYDDVHWRRRQATEMNKNVPFF